MVLSSPGTLLYPKTVFVLSNGFCFGLFFCSGARFNFDLNFYTQNNIVVGVLSAFYTKLFFNTQHGNAVLVGAYYHQVVTTWGKISQMVVAFIIYHIAADGIGEAGLLLGRISRFFLGERTCLVGIHHRAGVRIVPTYRTAYASGLIVGYQTNGGF